MVFAVLVMRWPTGLVLWHSEASSGAPTGQRRVSCRAVIPSECQLEKEREEMLLNNAGNLPRQKKPPRLDLSPCRCRWKSALRQILSFSLFSVHGCCHELFTISAVKAGGGGGGVFTYMLA